MERFDLRENSDVKIYLMVFRVESNWFVVTFRRSKLLSVFEVDLVEIVCGKWVETNSSRLMKSKIIEYLTKDRK